MTTPAARPFGFKDYLIIAGFTVAVLALLPLLALLGLALQVVWVVIAPALLIGSIVYAFVADAEPIFELVRGVSVPFDVRIHPSHSWARKASRSHAVIGVDDLAQRLIGAVETIEIATPGRQVEEGDVVAVLTRGRRSIPIRAPFAGVVSGVNPSLKLDPRIVNDAPYGQGWLLEMSTRKGWFRGLRRGERALRWMRYEIDRLVMLLAPEPAIISLPDGGEVVADVSSNVDEDCWQTIVAAFFSDPKAD
jgi:glycine cleavage system H protein